MNTAKLCPINGEGGSFTIWVDGHRNRFGVRGGWEVNCCPDCLATVWVFLARAISIGNDRAAYRGAAKWVCAGEVYMHGL